VSSIVVAHLLLVGGYAGFQWTVRALVYPQFAAVPPSSFAAYQSSHSRLIARVVGPLFAGQLVSTGWLLVERPADVLLPALVVSAVCLAVVLGVTALAAVPQHLALGAGFDRAAYARLLRADDVRVLAASVNVVASAWAVLG
jgi:hypothetical protein